MAFKESFTTTTNEAFKGFWRQATLLKNVATILFEFTDSRQSLKGKGRQFATATIHFYFRQSDMFLLCFFRQRSRYQASSGSTIPL